MKKNDNPIFTMIPARVLAQVKVLVDEFRAEAELKDMVWRNVIGVTSVAVLLVCANIANGLAFGMTAEDMLKGATASNIALVWIYAFIVIIGGLAFSLNAFVTWLELRSYRNNNPAACEQPRRLRFYRRATWLPLIPLSAVPAVFNAFFSVSFFLVTVAFAFVLMLVATLYADV